MPKVKFARKHAHAYRGVDVVEYEPGVEYEINETARFAELTAAAATFETNPIESIDGVELDKPSKQPPENKAGAPSKNK